MAGAGWTVSIAIPLNNANIQQGLRTLLSHIFASPPPPTEISLQYTFLEGALANSVHITKCSCSIQCSIQYSIQCKCRVTRCAALITCARVVSPQKRFVLCFSQCVTWTKIRDKKQLHCREFPWFVRSMYAVFRDKTQGSRSFFFLDFRF